MAAIFNGGLSAFFLGQFLSIFSGLFGLSVLSWHIVSRFGAAGIAEFMGAMALITLLSHLLLSPIGDRYDKLKVLKRFSWLVALRGLLLVYVVGLQDASLYWLVALQLVNGIAMAAIVPSRASLVVDMLPPDRVAAAYGLQSSVESAARVLGPAMAGLALVTFSVPSCLWVHAVLMLLACVLNMFLKLRPEAAAAERARQGQTRKSWLRDIADIWRARLMIPMERTLGLMGLVVACAYLPAMTMLIPLKVHHQGWSTVYLGMAEGMLAAGTLIAGLGPGAWVVKRVGRYRMLMCAGMAQGVALVVAGLASMPLLFALAYFLVGFFGMAGGLAMASYRMLATPRHFRARLGSAGMSLTMLAGFIGSYLCGIALQSFSVNGVQVLLGSVVLLGGLGYLLVPRLKEFMGLPAKEVELWYEREYRDAFK
ncbi:MFS transporter [Xylophilus sp. GW821-FHT01B05]